MNNSYDLFNPYIDYNYSIMIQEIDFTNFENPYIRVIWEDYPENFTQEKIQSVKHYFQKKYFSNNVNIITKTKSVDTVTNNVDLSLNILDQNYQLELIKQFLDSKSNGKYFDEVLKLNLIIDNILSSTEYQVTPFKKWYIKNIEFSNFLSYGENQKIDLDSCKGITVVESDPQNFGGKTILSIDLLLFLFFNETTKTTKAEEIFNRFTDKNKVFVKGEVTIDGEDYIIVRQIERKKSKSGDWTVKSELDFFKKFSDGSLQNFTGEQRRETENFIKSSIGTKEDFLMTILTTATNLEELIDSKPTARGQVLSRFLGLDLLKKKEEIGKQVYSDYAKTMLSNVYNTEQLKTDIESYESEIVNLEEKNKELKNQLDEIIFKINKGKEYRDNLLKGKFTIDNDIFLIVPTKVEEEIKVANYELESLKTKLSQVNVQEPSSYYYEEEHDDVKNKMNDLYKEIVKIESKISEINELKSSVQGGVKCEHCGIELINAAITQFKISELDSLIMQINEKNALMNELKIKEQSFISLKKEFDEYEKNKLIKEKFEISIERENLKIDSLKSKLDKYNEYQDKIVENNKIDTLIIKAGIRLDELEGEKTRIDKNIDNNIYTSTSYREKIDNNKKIILKINEETEKEKIYKLYLEVYGKNGITKIIMKTMMPLINNELQRLLENSCHFRLEIRINEKNEVEFVMIDNSTQIEKLMVSGSGYERTIASLALRAVLSKICSLPKPNIIVMDEVFGKISNENLDLVYDFFVKIKEYFEKIFLITHNPLISNWADKIIKVKKLNNISFI